MDDLEVNLKVNPIVDYKVKYEENIFPIAVDDATLILTLLSSLTAFGKKSAHDSL